MQDLYHSGKNASSGRQFPDCRAEKPHLKRQNGLKPFPFALRRRRNDVSHLSRLFRGFTSVSSRETQDEPPSRGGRVVQPGISSHFIHFPHRARSPIPLLPSGIQYALHLRDRSGRGPIPEILCSRRPEGFQGVTCIKWLYLSCAAGSLRPEFRLFGFGGIGDFSVLWKKGGTRRWMYFCCHACSLR